MSSIQSDMVDKAGKLEELNQLLTEAEQKLNDLKAEVLEKNEKLVSQSLSCQSFFQYTMVLPSPDEKLHHTFILGNFQITNNGAVSLYNPIICIKISPPSKASLSGKISYGKNLSSDDVLYESAEEWTYVQYNWRKKTRDEGEHWLKPLHITQLDPGETLTFSNFDVKFSEDTREEIRIEGYVYFKEIPKGKAALNHISLQIPST